MCPSQGGFAAARGDFKASCLLVEPVDGLRGAADESA
jgi:hypothetical protein